VRHRYVVTVDGIVDPLGPLRRHVRHELVAAQVPVDPGLGAAALLQAQDLAVELPRGVQIVDRHGEVEARDRRIENSHERPS
jgi:hypothetical protein